MSADLCTCGTPGLNYEGPQEDCPEHGGPGPASLPVLPYAGHSASPSTASGETTAWLDQVGITAQHQRDVYALVAGMETRGATVAEARRAFPTAHHGSLSGALSVLHLAGHLALLTDKRERCHVYVLPEHVNGRDTKAHASNRPKAAPAAQPDVQWPVSALAHHEAMLASAGIPYNRTEAPGPIPAPPGVPAYDPPLDGMFTVLSVKARQQPVPGGPSDKATTRLVFTQEGALLAIWGWS